MGSATETLIRLLEVDGTLRWRFSRNRACIFRELVGSPELIFLALKRRTFPLIKTLISSLSELYRIGKTCLKKMLQNYILKPENISNFQTRAVNSKVRPEILLYGLNNLSILPTQIYKLKKNAVSYTHLTLPTICSV